MERVNAWTEYNEKECGDVFSIGEDYKDLLSRCKTEREWNREIIARLEKNGYISLDDARKTGQKLSPGDKVYVDRMGKAVLSFHIGKEYA